MRQTPSHQDADHDPFGTGTLSRRALLRLLGALGLAAGAGPVLGHRLPRHQTAAAPPAPLLAPTPEATDPSAHATVGQSERFRAILARAGTEARQLGSPVIGTEHLLLALKRDFVTCQALAALGLHLRRARLTSGLSFLVPPGASPVAQPHLTPSAARAVAMAGEEAGRLNYRFAEPEHLLLGLLRARDHQVAAFLASHDITLDAARSHLALIAPSDD